MTSSATSWVGIVFLILFLGLMSGFWAGMVGLWRTRRGVAWWLMAVGLAFNTICPILYAVGTWLVFNRWSTSLGSGSVPSTTPTAMFSVVLLAAGILIPVGLILCSVGFALHGMKTARMASRSDELEAVTAAMSEEISRLRQGGPVA